MSIAQIFCRLRLAVIPGSIALLVACGGDSTAPEPVTPTPQLISNDDSSSLASPRELVVGSDTTRLTTITQCFCDALYRSTLLFYHFIDQKVVMTIEFDNTVSTFPATTDVHLFNESASDEDIRQWINNQHSD
ncbi:MAG: hypothetical protein AAF404_22505, partial [Pseudomonadota bacterium]